jgi:hypothetical protein
MIGAVSPSRQSESAESQWTATESTLIPDILILRREWFENL